MSKVIITIETGNAAFDGLPCDELARILRELARNIQRGETIPASAPLVDINGNTCGHFIKEG